MGLHAWQTVHVMMELPPGETDDIVPVRGTPLPH